MDDVIIAASEKVQSLSDLELAALIGLVAGQHCLVAADDDLLGDVEQELRLVAAETFGLTCQTIECSDGTTLDEFGDGILLNGGGRASFSDADGGKSEGRAREPGALTSLSVVPKHHLPGQSFVDRDEVAQVVIAKNLHRTSSQVQVQALELIRGKRIFSRTGFYTAPKQFLFIALLPASGASELISHLNDHFFISHYHKADDGFPNLEDHPGPIARGTGASMSSIVDSLADPYGDFYDVTSIFSKEDIDLLGQRSTVVRMSAEVRSYLHNIVTFMRLHRAVAGGVSSLATRHFHELVRILASLHGLDFVTPSLVALGARKIYSHRIMLVRPENERSLQWGSSLEAVRETLSGLTVDDVIDATLEDVEVPV